MITLTTTLLTGPYDWTPADLPQEEFDARIAAMRLAMCDAGADTLVVHGNSQEHGALAWATNFTPKLGPAFLVLPAQGAPCLLFSGGGGMAESAARLTWVADVRAIASLRRDVATALGTPSRVALAGLSAMSQASFTAFDNFFYCDLDPAINALRRRKSPREQALIAEAAVVLRQTAAMLHAAHAAGQGMRTASLTAEQAAYRAGAQDVCVLASHCRFGPPLALDDAPDVPIPQALAWLAVRRRGYWACADLTLGPSSALPDARAGLRHALTAPRGTLIGTALDEGASGTVEPGDALVLRVQHQVDDDRAILSALLLADGNRVVWPEDIS
jgi:hypothetical protein